MKKKLLILISILLILVGCGKKTETTKEEPQKPIEKYYLDDEYYTKGSITEITLEELNKLEDDKKNFMLFVYLPGCTSCAQFRGVLDEYIQEADLQFYMISILKVEDTTIKDVIEYAPSLVLYKDGKIVTALDATSDKDKPALKTKEGLINWLQKYIYLTK